MSLTTARDLKKFFYNNVDDAQIPKDQKETETLIDNFVQKRQIDRGFQTDCEKLKEALDDYEKILASRLWKPSAYVGLAFYTNMNDKNIKSKKGEIQERTKNLWQKIQFFELDLGKITTEQQQKIGAHKSLETYKHFLETIFNAAKYDLSDAEEKILSNLQKNSYSSRVDMLSNFFSNEEAEVTNEKGEKETKGFEELFSLFKSPNQQVRDEAAKKINEIVYKQLDIAENEINAVLEYKYQVDKMRGYETAETSRYIADDIDGKSIHALIESVQKYNHISQNWYKLKAKLLKKDQIAYHERPTPIGEITQEYSYEEACKIVGDMYQSLDPEFFEIFKGFTENGRVDVFPKQGKAGGAFQAILGHSEEDFVLLNFTNTFNDVNTLAHEIGHGIHTKLSKKHQHALHSGYGLAVAEVASIFMETALAETIVETISEKEKFYFYTKLLDDYVATIHRQIALYVFEIELHKNYREKMFLDKKEIGDIFKKHMEAYMGDGVSQDPGSENRRSYRSHIRSYFYTYSYAGGAIIAKALYKKVKEDKSFIHTIKEKFLGAGSSKSPKEIFASMDIDITQHSFRESGLQEIEELLEKTNKLAQQLGLI